MSEPWYCVLDPCYCASGPGSVGDDARLELLLRPCHITDPNPSPSPNPVPERLGRVGPAVDEVDGIPSVSRSEQEDGLRLTMCEYCYLADSIIANGVRWVESDPRLCSINPNPNPNPNLNPRRQLWGPRRRVYFTRTRPKGCATIMNELCAIPQIELNRNPYPQP